jgi:hypothetical protein
VLVNPDVFMEGYAALAKLVTMMVRHPTELLPAAVLHDKHT